MLNITPEIRSLIEKAVTEDLGHGDITTDSLIPESLDGTASIISKSTGIVSGLAISIEVFRVISPSVNVKSIITDGAIIENGDEIAQITGPLSGILKGERLALNFLQRLSGIATETSRYVAAIKGTNARIIDTRKTTPGLREFEKFAVSVGGGINHRFSLKDAVMIKDNHLVGNPNLKDAVHRAILNNPGKDIQVEVDTKKQLKEALNTGATSILLDNFDSNHLQATIKYIRAHKNGKNIYIELSGGITSQNINQYCIKGINGISIGALTHNIKSKDISLDLK